MEFEILSVFGAVLTRRLKDVIVAIPVSWHVAVLVKGMAFSAVGYVAIVTAVIFLAVGVRQWLVLSKWTRKYKLYKELQKRVDEKLDFEKEGTDETEKH
ncbi:MAG: hypothetical protein JRN52_01145 [Nitrososphaerota archaeon]|nr:hypothetical protein [Nitrososphaerota archaeon]